MKCPSCGKSLLFSKRICPFCKTALVGEATNPLDKSSEAGDGLVTVTQCGTLAEADAIRAQLEAAGIIAFLPDEALMQAIAWNVNTYGYIRIQVSARDYEAAKELLSLIGQSGNATPGELVSSLADIPLSWPMRWFALVMPALTCPGLLIFVVTKGAYSRQGALRKERDLVRWFLGGVAFWFISLVVLSGARQGLQPR